MTQVQTYPLDETVYRQGFVAHINGAEFDADAPGEWQDGWVDALELAELGPLVFLRADLEM